jgi:hypothetical protein
MESWGLVSDLVYNMHIVPRLTHIAFIHIVQYIYVLFFNPFLSLRVVHSFLSLVRAGLRLHRFWGLIGVC